MTGYLPCVSNVNEPLSKWLHDKRLTLIGGEVRIFASECSVVKKPDIVRLCWSQKMAVAYNCPPPVGVFGVGTVGAGVADLTPANGAEYCVPFWVTL